ncbi:MAG TPA: diaminopimelate epimerase [Syntrophomonas sp.]|nr:diaminopimelate epimerase [Syntrophomonas sp.]HPT68864.1 diaminopimelate epimerase [Syntrophomonas sp.]
MDFVKMHGLGNDFVIVETDSWNEADHLQKYAQFICDRHFGIGADGLVAVGPDEEMDIFMRIFNSDGSEPEMCGNGIRCVARYAYEKGWVKNNNISVRTLAGARYPQIETAAGKSVTVRVDMGQPVLERSLIPMQGEGSTVKVSLPTEQRIFEVTAVSMGNPHCINFVEDIDQVPVAAWGSIIEIDPMFPAKTNVEFVQILARDEMIMRVWERGAGITMACGTGACATLVAAVLNDLTDRKATIHLLGGDLHIEWNEENNHVYMTGPAEYVFNGKIEMKE